MGRVSVEAELTAKRTDLSFLIFMVNTRLAGMLAIEARERKVAFLGFYT